MDVIRLKNMVFYGYHGVSNMEKTLGGKYEVDLELYYDAARAGKTDSLEDTINYESIYKTVYNCTKSSNYYLVEALAESIAKQIVMEFEVVKLVIRIRKPHAPIRGVLDTVEVELERDRSFYE